jgi:hypothetical protein
MPKSPFSRLVGLCFAGAIIAFLATGFFGDAAEVSSSLGGLADSSTQTQAPAPAAAFENPDQELSPAALKDDFELLRFSLEQAHAGLYRYVPKVEMDRHFEALEKKLSHPLRISEFYAEVLKLAAAIRDGHTRVQAPSNLSEWLRKKPIRPPMAIHFEGGRVRVLKDASGLEPSAVGSDVLAVNGRPIAEVVDALLRYLPGDGYSDGRRSNLEYPDVFGGLFALEFGETEKYVFHVRSADGKERDVEVAGVPIEELEKRMGPLRPRPSGPLLSLRFEGEVAVLTVRSFGPRTLSGSGLSYPDFLTQAFQTLLEKRTESLIIDVRDNGGGNDEYGQILYAYLAPAPFYYYDRLQMNKEKSEFLPRTNDPGTGRSLTPPRLDEKGRWVRTDHPNLGLKQPREPVFSGRVFILENGRSFSATGEFMTAVYANKRGAFIGEESGAGITGNTSGIMIGVKLDNSGIVVSIPMVGYYMAGDHGPRPERGILPDHEVIPTVEDILAGRDPVMEFALEMARRPGR